MLKSTLVGLLLLSFLVVVHSKDTNHQPVLKKQPIHALYIPLADHYAAIIAYEKYRDQMKYAEFTIERMKNWDLLRSKFMAGRADLSFVMSPLAMDMFNENKIFRWIGLMHRDGNALAINDLVKSHLNLPTKRIDRKPTQEIADAFVKSKQAMNGNPVKCGMPHLLSTHTAVLYRFMSEHGKTLGIGQGQDKDLIAISIAPPKSPSYLKKNNSRGVYAAFDQSLPWADVVETKGFGYVAWYSKDVMPWKHGHVECIVLATNKAISHKREAIKEVNYFIHQAGQDIEKARRSSPEDLKKISDMIRRHIPEHNEAAIVQSLRVDLNVINYKHLNVDKKGLALIMKYAVDGNILKQPIDINQFANEDFGTSLTEQ